METPPATERLTTYRIKKQVKTYVAVFEENHPGADVTTEELVFLKAIERFQRQAQRRYPSWREVFSVLRSLGYRKVYRASELDFEALFPLEIALTQDAEQTTEEPS